MRIAVISDIHGNLTAFEAVLADLRRVSPDLTLHGGDLAHGGSNPTEIVDRLRDLGWQGVIGNTDEMLAKPETLEEFAGQSPHLEPLFSVIREMAAVTRETLGEDRLAWLAALPRIRTHGSIALVHASPASLWRAPAPEANDDELESTYASLSSPLVVYAHIHRPFVREISAMTVVNTGSVSLSYDGNPRASYLLIDDLKLQIRRIEYDVDREIQALAARGFPHSDWLARSLQNARFEMP